MKKFGLEEHIINKIKGIFLRHPDVKEVLVYGSRAKGNYKHGSDLDLIITKEYISLSEQLAIENELDDLLLPYKIDLSVINQISNENLLHHIQRVGLIFYKQIS